MTTAELPEPRVRERSATERPGLGILVGGALGVLVAAAVLVGGVALVTMEELGAGIPLVVVGGVAVIALVIVLGGLTVIQPGEARVLQFLGRYVGSARTSGIRWVNPFTTRTRVSTRIRNQETSVLKVNDTEGNPIEIAAVVVWQV